MRNFLTHFPWLFGHPEVPRIEVDRYGVSVLCANDVIHFTWFEIKRIDALKRDFVRKDEVILEFWFKSSDRVVSISEDYTQFAALVSYLENEWPKISADWRSKVMLPAFKDGRVTVYPGVTQT